MKLQVTISFLALIVIGSMLKSGWELFIENRVSTYIKDPVISSHIGSNLFSTQFILTNDNYEITCIAKKNVPIKEVFDTTFHVYTKAGSRKILFDNKSPVLKQYFKEYFKWE